ncbi:MAG: transglycosylase SLT domain-containing protein [Bacteroidales bacterium]|nr:transglycosylase SLT domain-containing protein [Bacteroidales bacterium]
MGQACATSAGGGEAEAYRLPDTLRVGTLYSPTSFFIYRGDTLGYDYDRICDFAKDKKIALKFTIAHSMQSLLQLAKDDAVDVLAYEIPVTAEFNQEVLHCGETNTTYQVLVQKKGGRRVSNVTQLRGKDVYVEKGSKYESRLENLNSEIGGGINIKTVDKDTVDVQELVNQVSTGAIPYTIVDSDIAKINRTYYDNIDIALEVSFPQRSSWAVNLNNNALSDTIDAWSTSESTILYSEDISRHYFEQSRYSLSHDEEVYRGDGRYQKKPGDISPFDDLFKAYAGHTSYPWQLLAAIAYTESRFDPNVVSWAGAKGLMQIMPSTARGYGFDTSRLHDPEVSVKAAVRELAELEKYFSGKVPDSRERLRFMLAAYNGGIAHVIDAIKLAGKYGKNPRVWYGNVEEALKWKANEHYYNDPVCKYGYFRSTETVNYVQKVEDRFEAYKKY